MSRSFPPGFSLAGLTGQQAAEYASSAEAFQALVGDWLKEECPVAANVYPAMGNDGEIDIYLESADPDFFRLGPYHLQLPAIVQCRYSSRGDLGSLKSGWRKTVQRLQNAAKNEWQGLYEPWAEARQYVYVVGAVFANQMVKNKLRASICETLAKLPLRGDLEVLLLDWAELRLQLSAKSRLVDRWLGLGSAGLKPHEDFLKTLVKTKCFLLSDNLPFVALDTEWQPARVFQLLCEGEACAVAFIGPGGVGKTRLLIEVANRANEAGWRVLHIQVHAGLDFELLYRDLAEEFDGRTLLVADYADQLPREFFRFIHDLQDELSSIGRSLEVVGSARPGRRLSIDGYASRWRTFEVALSVEQSRAVAGQIRARLAPTAGQLAGAEALEKLTGNRPIIALLISRELEEAAIQGRTFPEDYLPSAPELRDWMVRRFTEQALTPRDPPGPLATAESPKELVAAAAVLASTPAEMEVLESVAVDALKAGEPGYDTAVLLSGLRQMGWLEDHGEIVDTPHDLIADELLLVAMWRADHRALDERAARQILSPARRSLRVWVRIATAFDRLRALDDDIAAALHGVVSRWLFENVAVIAQSLRQAYSIDAGRSLLALSALDLWAEALLRDWLNILRPYLSRHRQSQIAPYLLAWGLQDSPLESRARVVEDALDWIERSPEKYSHGYLLPPLAQSPLAQLELQRAVRAADTWLQKNGSEAGAQYVVNAFLNRSDLTPNDDESFVKHAEVWLARYLRLHVAWFVLWISAKALRRKRHSARSSSLEQKNRIATAAVEWLREHGSSLEAGPIFEIVLRNPTISKELRTEVVDIGLKWLESGELSEHGQSVVTALLYEKCSSVEAEQACVRYALKWLSRNGDSARAQFLLKALLEKRLDDDTTLIVIGAAVRWLENNAKAVNRGFIVNRLLPLWARLESEQRRLVVQEATRLLDESVRGEHDGHLMGALDRLGQAVEEFPKLAEALGRVRALTGWREGSARAREEGKVLLQRLSGEEKVPEEEALEWVLKSGNDAAAEWSRLVEKLLTSRLSLEQEEALAEVTVQWLASPVNFRRADWSFLLQAALRKEEQLGEKQRAVVALGMQWLEDQRHFQLRGWRHVFREFASRISPESDDGRRLLDAVIEWLRRSGREQEDHFKDVWSDAMRWLRAAPEGRRRVEEIRHLRS